MLVPSGKHGITKPPVITGSEEISAKKTTPTNPKNSIQQFTQRKNVK